MKNLSHFTFIIFIIPFSLFCFLTKSTHKLSIQNFLQRFTTNQPYLCHLKNVSNNCAVLLAFMWEQGLCSKMTSLEPGSHILSKKTVYLFDTDFNLLFIPFIESPFWRSFMDRWESRKRLLQASNTSNLKIMERFPFRYRISRVHPFSCSLVVSVVV